MVVVEARELSTFRVKGAKKNWMRPVSVMKTFKQMFPKHYTIFFVIESEMVVIFGSSLKANLIV